MKRNPKVDGVEAGAPVTMKAPVPLFEKLPPMVKALLAKFVPVPKSTLAADVLVVVKLPVTFTAPPPEVLAVFSSEIADVPLMVRLPVMLSVPTTPDVVLEAYNEPEVMLTFPVTDMVDVPVPLAISTAGTAVLFTFKLPAMVMVPPDKVDANKCEVELKFTSPSTVKVFAVAFTATMKVPAPVMFNVPAMPILKPEAKFQVVLAAPTNSRLLY